MCQINYPDMAAPGSAEMIRSFTGLAVKSGVRRMVLHSGRGEKEARRCEQIVQDAGVQWTLVRSSWFCQNFSESFMLEPIQSGEVALTEDAHAGRLYEVTGSRLLTFAQAAERIAQASGRPIHYIQVSVDEDTAAFAELGVPGPFVELVTYLFSEVLDGRNAHLTDGVQQALGRAPRDFSGHSCHWYLEPTGGAVFQLGCPLSECVPSGFRRATKRERNLYMAAEVKRKHYPLRIGFYVF